MKIFLILSRERRSTKKQSKGLRDYLGLHKGKKEKECQRNKRGKLFYGVVYLSNGKVRGSTQIVGCA
ncbi:MAG: hypothetical protein ACM3SR_17785 [Ignavibacteriales bacterium]